MTKINTTLRLDEDEHAQWRMAMATRRLSAQQALYEAWRLWMSCAGMPISPAMNGHALHERSESSMEQSE